MSEKTIKFGDKKINKIDFYNNKKQFTIEDIDINKILISKPESCDKNNMRKYIIGYNDKTISLLQLFLPKMTGYLNIFKDGNRKMSFLSDNNEFLERYIEIWEKISDLINKKFDSDPVYNNKYINTKIRSYNNDIMTNFHDMDNKNNKNNKLPEKNKPYKCVSLISLDSIIKINGKYYPQTLLQECVYKLINKKVENIITNINLNSSSESENESNNESEYE